MSAPAVNWDEVPPSPERRRADLFQRIAENFDAIAEYADMGMRHASRGNETQSLVHAKECGAHLRDIGDMIERLRKIRPADESFEYGH
jgi:hypothetical protein